MRLIIWSTNILSSYLCAEHSLVLFASTEITVESVTRNEVEDSSAEEIRGF